MANFPTAAATLAPLCLSFGLGLFASCKPFQVDIGTKDPIRLEPVNINIRMDVYQHSSDKLGDAKKDDEDAKSARDRIYNRQQQVQDLKNNRWVVETHRGELLLREKPAGENGTWAEKVVKEENEDRVLLMRLKAKELNLDLHEIQAQFWKDNVEKAYAGEWIEVPDPTKPGIFKFAKKDEPAQ